MLPATIITGFLGSGKTTLLNRLLKHPGARNSLVVINEFGEIGIDHLVVSMPAENVRLLANGCMCCQTKGDLVETLTNVWSKRESAALPAFDRVLIETTGLADPVPIVQTLVTDDPLSTIYRLDLVITVVDAVHAHSQLASHDEARKQVAVADLLLLSKTDLVDPAELPELDAALKAINPGAERLAAAHGAADPHRLLDGGAARRDMARWLESIDDGAEAHHPHADGIRTFSAALEAPVSEVGLATWLSMLTSLKGPQLLRVKGIVNVAGEPYVVDVVRSVVHEPRRLEAWPAADRRTRLVFIVRDVAREAIEKTFAAFAMGDSLPRSRQFDPSAYARFRQVADRFVELEEVTVPAPRGRASGAK